MFSAPLPHGLRIGRRRGYPRPRRAQAYARTAVLALLLCAACSRSAVQAAAELERLGWELEAGALATAVSQGNPEIVDLILAVGVDPNEPTSGGVTPLMVAARRGDLKLVQRLVQAGAELDLQDHQRRTALMYAIEHRHPDVVEWLLDQGADPNLRDDHARTALGYAQRQKLEQVVVMLRDEGAIH